MLAKKLRDGARLAIHPVRFWREHRRLTIGLVVVAVLGVAGIVVAYELLKRPADVHNTHGRFKPRSRPAEGEDGQLADFGLNPARTRYLPAKGVSRLSACSGTTPRSPCSSSRRSSPRQALRGQQQRLAFALDADTGKVLWERRIGSLNASSPGLLADRLYIVNLVPGHIVKLDARTGKMLWKRSLPGRAESSPLVLGDTLYFGCENGQLFALSTRNGNVRWATTLGGPVKSAPAYYNGALRRRLRRLHERGRAPRPGS